MVWMVGYFIDGNGRINLEHYSNHYSGSKSSFSTSINPTSISDFSYSDYSLSSSSSFFGCPVASDYSETIFVFDIFKIYLIVYDVDN